MSQSDPSPSSSGMSPTNAPPHIGWRQTLRDGTAAWIRPIDKHDTERELEFLHRLSPEYRHLRFLGLVRDPSPEVARAPSNLDPANAAGFVTVVPRRP